MTAKQKKPVYSEAELNEFKSGLLTLREGILREVRSQIAKKREIQDHIEVHDFQDKAADETDREMQFLLTDRDRAKLIEIDDALARFENGTYGICEDCEEVIPKERLQAMPYTRYTLDCQIEMEEIAAMERARQLEEDEKQYIEFSMNEPDEIDQD